VKNEVVFLINSLGGGRVSLLTGSGNYIRLQDNFYDKTLHKKNAVQCGWHLSALSELAV
jgi:hypothetical protein